MSKGCYSFFNIYQSGKSIKVRLMIERLEQLTWEYDLDLAPGRRGWYIWKYRLYPLTASTVPRQLAGLNVIATWLDVFEEEEDGRKGILVAASSAHPSQSA